MMYWHNTHPFKKQKKAEKSKVWSQSSNKEAVPNQIFIDQQEFDLFKKEDSVHKLTIRNSFKNHPVLEVVYEDLLKDTENQLYKIQQFLKVSPRNLFSLLQKQSSRELKYEILNWADFEEEI